MTGSTFYVLHSPYPDKSWRGVEKCAGSAEAGGPLLFHSRAEAALFAQERELTEFMVVETVLMTPAVREKLGGE